MKNINVKKKKKLYEGKAKILYETDHEDYLIQEFKDDATAFDGEKKGKIKSKGSVNNQISAHLFNFLESYHVPTHFHRPMSDNSMVIKRLNMVPLEVVMRNVATGSYVKRNKVDEGKELDSPVLEFFLKDDTKHDPLIEEEDILSSGHATDSELQQIRRYAQKTNAVLRAFFIRRNVVLVDFKLEFGRNKSGRIVLADEISPDTCRFWDSETSEKLDKDRFRQDLGKVEAAYQEMLRRVLNDPSSPASA